MVYCVTTMRDVTSTASDAVSEGTAAVGEPDDMGSGSAREVELTRGVEDDACTTDSIMEGVLVITELAVVLATGKRSRRLLLYGQVSEQWNLPTCLASCLVINRPY